MVSSAVVHVLIAEFADESLQALITDLTASGFHPYLTSVGGSGVGLRRSQQARNVIAEGGDETFHVTSRMAFTAVPKEQLESWAAGQGEWQY
jgi:hypothetical protein